MCVFDYKWLERSPEVSMEIGGHVQKLRRKSRDERVKAAVG